MTLMAASALTLSTCEQPELNGPIGLANGTFTNDCCGDIVLSNGTMTVAGQKIGYGIDQDKVNTFVMTEYYVGPSRNGFVIERGHYPLKMYLDTRHNPSEIRLISSDGTYSFRRVAGS
ncbi:MAG: hypothetical protein ACKOQ3_03305 [Novosphingobium sp.]